MIRSPQFTQDVPTGFQVTSPPVLEASPNQMAILSRGTDITMTETRDMTLGDSVQYTSMVGTMLAEAMAVNREEVSPKLRFDWLS